MEKQNFILRTIHIDSGTVSNQLIGSRYSISRDSLKYYPELKDPELCYGVLVGCNENVILLNKSDYDYYVMTGSGETFEKINVK